MTTRRFIQVGIWAAMTALLFIQLAACGGGSGSNLADGGVGGTGVVAAGAVTAKASITVNGIAYSVEGARFVRDGDTETLSEGEMSTRVGMVVEVTGTLNDDGLTGQATDILFQDVVEGRIDSAVSNSPDIKILTILAQQVVVERVMTSFDGLLDFDNIDSQSGFLEISGFRRADGLIQASYIEEKTAGQFELVGTVSAIDATSFMIGDLTVIDSSQQDQQVGNLVRVEGVNYTLATRTLLATSVNPQTAGLGVEDAEQAEIEGFVSGSTEPIPAGVIFQVNGQDVRYTQATEFSGGTAADLLNNVKVEVEGPLANGVLIAEKISFDENLRFQGTVTARTASSLTLTYPDDLTTTTDVTVTIDPAVTEEKTPFEDVAVGDYVRLEGLLSGGTGNVALATRLRELDPDDRIILQGPADIISNPTGFIEILGVSIDTNGLTLSDNDNVLTQDEFFSALQTNDGIAVKAQGDTIWSELELER